MSTFEERKEEFLNYIKEDEEVLNRIVTDNMYTDEGKKTLGVIFTPKDDRELIVAKTLYSITADFIKLIDGVYFNEIKEIPYEENVGLKFYIDSINALKNNEEIKYDFDVKKNAEIVYSSMVAILDDAEEAYGYVAKETGFDLDDQVENTQFVIYMDKVKEYMDKVNQYNKDYKECTDEELNKALEFSLEFHKVCEKGKINYEEEKGKVLSKEMKDQINKIFDK